MPPQVGRAGEGTKPVVTQTTDVEQTQSSELEKKITKQQKSPSESSTTQTHSASPEEKTGKLKELSLRGDLTKATLNNRLKSLNTYATVEQGVAQLSQRKYPQDIIPGQMFEVEEIRRGDTNKIRTEKKAEYTTVNVSIGANLQVAKHPKQFRDATQSGLQERLSELNAHGPLTDFEKNLVLRFGDSKKGEPTTSNEVLPRIRGGITSFAPIKGLDSKGEKIDKEVQAYRVKDGNAITYYDRNGKELQWGINEEPLIDRNLGPIDLWPAGQVAKQVGGKIAKKVAEKVVAKEVTTVAKAEVKAAAKEVASVAKSETKAAAKEASSTAQPATQPATQPAAQPAAPVAPPAAPPVAPPVWNPPVMTPGGEINRQVFVRTQNSLEKITVGEYRNRVQQARQWITAERAERAGIGATPGGSIFHGPTQAEAREAAQRFGLDDGWDRIGNPLMGRNI